MTVVDVNTGKFVGSGGNLEETVTKNNIEAAEEIVRQLRLRDIGGIIVIDFIDMVLESNRDLVVRRLLECLGRDRTKHQVAEVTSLGLVQMTRKRVGSGLIEVFSETCDHCNGRGFIIHTDPVDRGATQQEQSQGDAGGSSRRRGRGQSPSQGSAQRRTATAASSPVSSRASRPSHAESKSNGPTAAQIAAAAHAAALKSASGQPAGEAAGQAVRRGPADARSGPARSTARPAPVTASPRTTVPGRVTTPRTPTAPTGRPPRVASTWSSSPTSRTPRVPPRLRRHRRTDGLAPSVTAVQPEVTVETAADRPGRGERAGAARRPGRRRRRRTRRRASRPAPRRQRVPSHRRGLTSVWSWAAPSR